MNRAPEQVTCCVSVHLGLVVNAVRAFLVLTQTEKHMTVKLISINSVQTSDSLLT